MIHDWTDGYTETIMKKLSLCNCQHQSALGRTKENEHSWIFQSVPIQGPPP